MSVGQFIVDLEETRKHNASFTKVFGPDSLYAELDPVFVYLQELVGKTPSLCNLLPEIKKMPSERCQSIVRPHLLHFVFTNAATALTEDGWAASAALTEVKKYAATSHGL